MSINSLIEKFSAGKIVPKYHLVVPKYSNFTRNLIGIVFGVIGFTVIGFLISNIELKDQTGPFLLLIAFAVFVTFLMIYIVGKVTLNYSIIGIIRFQNEHISIQNKNEVRIIEYDSILRINFCGNIRSSINQPEASINYKTYKVKIFLQTKENLILEITREMFFSEEDENLFRASPPLISHVFEAINPPYGIIADAKI